MGATVYASPAKYTEVYHFDRKCTHFHTAQDMNDGDCGCDMYCTHTRSRLHPLKRMSDEYATVNRRLWPCRYCVPPHLKKFPPSETFGHEPITREGGRVLCARCVTHVRRFRWDVDGEIFTGASFLPVRWPCTSAVVLGLAPREVEK